MAVEVGLWGTRGSDGENVVSIKDYRGADEDKPSEGVSAGSTYFAWDTSKLYMYDGTQWQELFAGA